MTKRACTLVGIDCGGYGYHELRAQAWSPRKAPPAPEERARYVYRFKAPCVCLAGEKWAKDHAP